MTVPRFWRKIENRYNLIGTRCESCGEAFFPPRRMCPTCRRDSAIVGHKFPRRGEIVTFTVIRTAPAAFDHQTPYVVAIIETPEGTRFTTQLVGTEPDEVEIGMPVEATFRKIAEDGSDGAIHYGVKFKPARE